MITLITSLRLEIQPSLSTLAAWAGEIPEPIYILPGEGHLLLHVQPNMLPAAKLSRKVCESLGLPPYPSRLEAPPGQEAYPFLLTSKSPTPS